MTSTPKNLSRRDFAKAAAAFGAVLATASPVAAASRHKWQERRDLYPEGVASGDPQPESVILWTRRAPSGKSAPKLTMEIAEDEAFTRVVATAAVVPKAENDGTVRVLAAGLKPATTYWYRFSDAQGLGSRIGRTRTAPAENDARPVAFTFVSCQNQNAGANNAYRRMIYEDMKKPEAEQIGFVLHLGDFVYELVWYPEDRPQGYLGRKIRDIVRYPKGEKVDDNHVPVDLGDYRTLYRGYLADPDLADARARWPFIYGWDNHEFSWRGFQGLTDFGKGVRSFQTRKVAAVQAWFEYQPARVRKAGKSDLNHFDAPKVEDAPVTTFDDHGLGDEPNNLTAISALTMYRQLRYGKNVDVVVTDNRSYRSRHPVNEDAANDLVDPKYSELPLENVEILDAGRTYNNGNPPAVISFAGKQIPNFRKDKPAQSMLGVTQKAWFLDRLRASTATWKVWGNSQGSLDARFDMKNLPVETFGTWPGKDYSMQSVDDWSGYRVERGEILDFVKANGITGMTSVCGDRHCFMAGVLSKALPPYAYEPVALEFVGTSISSPGSGEVYELRMKDDNPLHALFISRRNGAVYPSADLTVMHGVRASLTYDKTGDVKAALAQSNPEVAPHLSFSDQGAQGYSLVRASAETLETEFVCIPHPHERSGTDDGGPILYRVVHRAKIWQQGETPKLEQTVVEGKLPLT